MTVVITELKIHKKTVCFILCILTFYTLEYPIIFSIFEKGLISLIYITILHILTCEFLKYLLYKKMKITEFHIIITED